MLHIAISSLTPRSLAPLYLLLPIPNFIGDALGEIRTGSRSMNKGVAGNKLCETAL